MSKLVKGFLIVFSSIIGLIIAAVVIIPLVVDLNDYKPEIETLVKDKTGRTLKIEGQIDLSIFPWIGVSTGKLTLSNAKGFKETNFAVINESDIKVKLLPLLSKEVEVSTVVLKGLQLNLAKNEQGISNWDDLTAQKVTEPKPADISHVDADKSTSPALAALAIGGLVIEDSQVTWDDQQAKQHSVIKAFNLKLGAVAFNQAIPVTISLVLENTSPGLTEQLSLSTQVIIDNSMQKVELQQLVVDSKTTGSIVSGGVAQVNLQSDIKADLKSQQFNLSAFKLESKVEGSIIPGGLLTAVLTSEIAIDLQQQTAKLSDLQLNSNLLNVSGNIDAQKITDKPSYSGAIKIAQFSPKALLQQLQMAVPKTSDESVLNKLAMQFNLQGTQNSIALEKLVINLDDTQVNGFARVSQFNKPAIAFKLVVDTIDVDRYTAPPEKTTPLKTATPATAVAATTTLIPVETIRGLNIQGDLSIAQLKVAKLTMSGVSLNLKAKNGVVTTKQKISKLYKGSYSGQLTVNAKSKKPRIFLNEKISGVQLEPLFSDMQLNQSIKLKGTANIKAKLNTQGNTVSEMKSTLAGNFDFVVKKGALTGFNVQKMIDLGRMFAQSKTMQGNYNNEQTLFTVLQGSARVKQGVINNPDLLLDSSTIEVKGGGTANLVNEALNYKLAAKVKQASTKSVQVKGRPIVIKVAGTFAQPSYKVDVLSMVTEHEQKKINKEIDKHLGEGTGKAVNDLLKSFF